MALSFANDIRPLFRDNPDIDSMKEYGLDRKRQSKHAVDRLNPQPA